MKIMDMKERIIAAFNKVTAEIRHKTMQEYRYQLGQVIETDVVTRHTTRRSFMARIRSGERTGQSIGPPCPIHQAGNFSSKLNHP